MKNKLLLLFFGLFFLVLEMSSQSLKVNSIVRQNPTDANTDAD